MKQGKLRGNKSLPMKFECKYFNRNSNLSPGHLNVNSWTQTQRKNLSPGLPPSRISTISVCSGLVQCLDWLSSNRNFTPGSKRISCSSNPYFPGCESWVETNIYGEHCFKLTGITKGMVAPKWIGNVSWHRKNEYQI